MEVLDGSVQSQRGIAHASGFSLGMTNLLLKRLAGKGFIKIITLNGRTLKYMLTPRGFTEKLRKSYEYIVRSIRQMNQLKESIQWLAREKGGPERRILVAGRNELADLVKQCLAEIEVEFEAISLDEQIDFGDEYQEALLLQCDVATELPSSITERRMEVIQTGTLL